MRKSSKTLFGTDAKSPKNLEDVVSPKQNPIQTQGSDKIPYTEILTTSPFNRLVATDPVPLRTYTMSFDYYGLNVIVNVMQRDAVYTNLGTAFLTDDTLVFYLSTGMSLRSIHAVVVHEITHFYLYRNELTCRANNAGYTDLFYSEEMLCNYAPQLFTFFTDVAPYVNRMVNTLGALVNSAYRLDVTPKSSLS